MAPFNLRRPFFCDLKTYVKKLRCSECRVRYTANKGCICTVCIKKHDRLEELGKR